MKRASHARIVSSRGADRQFKDTARKGVNHCSAEMLSARRWVRKEVHTLQICKSWRSIDLVLVKVEHHG
jgi:hypothetical protein